MSVETSEDPSFEESTRSTRSSDLRHSKPDNISRNMFQDRTQQIQYSGFLPRTQQLVLCSVEMVVPKDDQIVKNVRKQHVHSIWKNPFVLFIISMTLAWIYLIMPNIDFYFYNFVKNQWWVFLVTVSVAEGFNFCLPDALPVIYHCSYVMPFLVVVFIRVVQIFSNSEDNFGIKAIAVTTVNFTVICLYGIDVFLLNKPTATMKRGDGEQAEEEDDSPSRFSHTDPETCIVGVDNPIRDSSLYMRPKETAPQAKDISSFNNATHFASSEEFKALLRRFQSRVSGAQSNNKQSNFALYDIFSVSKSAKILSDDTVSTASNDSIDIEDKVAQTQSTGKVGLSTGTELKSLRRLAFLRADSEYKKAFRCSDESSVSGSSSISLSSTLVVAAGTTTTTTEGKSSSLRKSIFAYILPRYYYDLPSPKDTLQQKVVKIPLVLGSRKQLWGYASLYMLLFSVNYTFLIYYTNIFRAVSQQRKNTSVQLLLLFLVYLITTTILRVIFKRIGMECDKLKMNTTSMFFVGEYICLMFYYTFYRVLFESIPDWPTFFALEACHLFFEWICYPLRASDTLNRFLTQNLQNLGCCGRMLENFFCPYGLNFIDWQYFIALDFGIRCFIICSSGISFTITIVSVSYMPWVSNELAQSDSRIGFILVLVIVSVAVEMVNAMVVDFLFFRRKSLDVYVVVTDCFQDNRFAFITTILGALLIINPIYAFTTDNTF